MWRLPGGFLPFSGFPMLPLYCYLELPPGALPCENILFSDFVESSGSLAACHPFAGHTLGNNLVHIGLCYSRPWSFVAVVVVTSSIGISIAALWLVAVVSPESLFFRVLANAWFYVPNRRCLSVKHVVLAAICCVCT